MIQVRRSAGFALIVCVALAVAMVGRSQTVPLKNDAGAAKIDGHTVWKPSEAAVNALNDATTAGKGTQETLLQVMKEDHAPAESVAFARSFSTEGAYLSAIDPNPDTDGLTIGTVSYPFRTAAVKTFVILNAAPRIVDVSDQKVIKGINISKSPDYGKLFGTKTQAQCIWYEPKEYRVQPGKDERTQFEVIYPVVNSATQKVIGYAHVTFSFAGKARRSLPPELEFLSVEKN